MSTRLISSLPVGGTGDISRDDVFDTLRNERRRYALHYLRQQDGPVELSELSKHVAAWEYEIDAESVDSEAIQRVYVSFLQNHVPKMEERGIVRFDESAGSVELAENASNLEVYLEIVADDDILWAQYYLGVTGIGTLFLVLVWLGIPPFGTFIHVVWAAIVAMFGGSALLHHRYLRQRRLGAEERPDADGTPL